MGTRGRAVTGARRLLLGLALGCGCEGGAGPWESAAPETAGLHPAALERWAHDVASHDTEALLVLVRGHKVVERYDWGAGPEVPQHVASLAKGVVGGVALVLLASDGSLDLDEPVARYLPRWRDDPERSRITFRQLATHSSGLSHTGRPGERAEPWAQAFWALDSQRTPIHVALEDAPLDAPPGEAFAYSNSAFAVLSAALAAALREAPSEEPRSLPEYLGRRLFDPLGAERREWSIGYRRSFGVDGHPTWAVWGGARMSPSLLARLGAALLAGGVWQGRPLLSPDAVAALLRPSGTPRDPRNVQPAPALGWWSNAKGTWPRLPRDAALALGDGHQVLLVVPSLDLVLVRLGRWLDPQAPPDEPWEPLDRILLAPLMEAFPRESPRDPPGESAAEGAARAEEPSRRSAGSGAAAERR